jgi:hypothetical protein
MYALNKGLQLAGDVDRFDVLTTNFMTLGSLKIVGAFTNAPIRMVYMEMVYMLVTMQKKLVRNRIGGAYDFEN